MISSTGSLVCLLGLLAAPVFAQVPEGTGVTDSTLPTNTNTADFPSLTGVPQCGLECFSIAVEDAGCDGILQTECYCLDSGSRQRFLTRLVQCNSVDCPDQLQASENIAAAYCKVANVALTFPAPTTTRATPGPTGSGGSGSTQPTKSAAAVRDNALSSLGWAAGAAVAFVGMF